LHLYRFSQQPELRRIKMKTAFRFSALVYAPLLIAFLLPAPFLLPTGFLLTIISVFDPTISISESVGYHTWVFSPMAAAIVLFLVGMWSHSIYLRGRSRKTVWVAVWMVFSVALFAAAWLGTTILTSIGASDYPSNSFFQWTASIAALLTLVFQPVVGLWLFISSRIFRRLELEAS
jgi:RsiW-degrading membrane proteinase PrsW (M82 family)